MAVVVATVVGAGVGFGVPAAAQFGAAVSALLATCGLVIILAMRRFHDAFSVLGLIAGFYALVFGVGAVYFYYDTGHSQGFSFTASALTAAVAMAILALLSLATGYTIDPFRAVTRRIPSVPLLANGRADLAAAACVYLIGWAARLALLASGRYFHTATQELQNTGSTALVAQLATLPTLAVALVGASSYMRVRKTRAFQVRLAFWGLAAVDVAWYVPTGERGRLVGLVLMILIIRFYAASRRVPWVAILAGAVILVVVVFPFGVAYRGGGTTFQSDYQTEPGRNLVSAAETTLTASPGAAVDTGLRTTFARFSDVASVATMLTQGADVIGRPHGQTLVWALEAAVPRAVFPAKFDPGTFGNEFGRDYDILTPTNRTASIAVSQPGELFLNFGWVGVILGMLVIGGLYRLVNDYLIARNTSTTQLAIYAVLAGPLLNGLENIVAVGFASVAEALVIYVVVLWAAKRVVLGRGTGAEYAQSVSAA